MHGLDAVHMREQGDVRKNLDSYEYPKSVQSLLVENVGTKKLFLRKLCSLPKHTPILNSGNQRKSRKFMRVVFMHFSQVNPNSVSRGYRENPNLSQALASKNGTRPG